jgi:polyisoprenyl-phosphate glycosyltransferase
VESVAKLDLKVELVFVDDGSSDDTFRAVCDIAKQDPRVKALRFARNHGKEIAMSAGLDFASGAAAVLIDADLQHPPEAISLLVQKWRDGFDMVVAERRPAAHESSIRRWFSKNFYRLYNALSDVSINPSAGDFRLLDRRAIVALQALPERTRFMKGMFGLAGLSQAEVAFDVQARSHGQSRFGGLRLWRFAIDGLTSFSSLPLRVWSYIGIALVIPTGVYAVWTVLKTLIWGVDTPGYATLATLVLFLGGIQLMSLGVLGEYIGRVFTEVKQRPLYVVSDTSDASVVPTADARHGGIVLAPRRR